MDPYLMQQINRFESDARSFKSRIRGAADLSALSRLIHQGPTAPSYIKAMVSQRSSLLDLEETGLALLRQGKLGRDDLHTLYRAFCGHAPRVAHALRIAIDRTSQQANNTSQ